MLNEQSDDKGQRDSNWQIEQRSADIEKAAYLKAEKRGFTAGHELEDWLEAEREVDEAQRPVAS
jgi:hypothetical protein